MENPGMYIKNNVLTTIKFSDAMQNHNVNFLFFLLPEPFMGRRKFFQHLEIILKVPRIRILKVS